MFEVFSRHFWVLAIATSLANYPILSVRLSKLGLAEPERERYASLLRNFFLWLGVPWIVMGLGNIVGGVPSVWHFFRPQDGNPYVLAWFASVFLLWVLSVYWVFFKGGAEVVAMHPDLFGLQTSNPAMVKLYVLLCLAGGVAGVVMMWTMDVPIPPLR